MTPYSVQHPLVIVHNYLETFRTFLLRTGDERILMSRRFNGDQALFWMEGDKLLISSAPVENAGTLMSRWGYPQVKNLSPTEPSAQLSLDILHQPELREAIRSHAGEGKHLTLISYSATSELYQLVRVLENEDGLKVDLPEIPLPENLWVKQYIDTKVGFRSLVTGWLGENALPRGYITDQPEMVQQMVADFARQGSGAIVKANQGGSGVGNLFLPLENHRAGEDPVSLRENIFLQQDVFVVEEWIQSREMVSPSLEFYVPPIGAGTPKITYLCNQHFLPSGQFAGVIVGKEIYQAPWYPAFRENGLAIASNLQAMGYVGHFDLDAIVSDEGRLYLVEVNARRTGGTYVHEFLTRKYGQDYADQVTMLSQNALPTRFTSLDALEEAIGALLYPLDGQEKGVIVMLTSNLPRGKFGYLILGDSVTEVTALRQKLIGLVK
ncbi:hypothetical protein KQH54_00200 [bacterium]|nr:hypothetical protein [bacterium]